MFANMHRIVCTYTLFRGAKCAVFCRRLVHIKRNFDINYKEINIPVLCGNVSGKWWGSTEVQPVLAVHGWEDNAGSFDRLVPPLNASVLAIDLPGHGFSSHCPLGTTYNFMDGVSLIRQIVRHFKWEDITIIGHSYGSALAFAYSAFFPKNVKNLIGIECVRAEMMQKSDSVAITLRKAMDSALYFDDVGSKNPPVYSLLEMVDILYNRNRGQISKKSCELLLKRDAKKVGEGKYVFSRDPRLAELPIGRMTKELLLACSPRISCNVLNITANPGGSVTKSLDYTESVKSLKSSAKVFEEYTVEGFHHVHLDSPETVFPIVKMFLSTP